MRDGNHSVGQLISIGEKMLGRRHVLPSVTATLTQLQVEGTFPTGTHLVTVDQPISSEDGDMENALYGSFLPHPANDLFSLPAESEYEGTSMPGAMSVAKVGKIVLNEGRRRVTLKVTNKGDRPIQVSWRSISATRRTVLSERVFSAANRSGRTIRPAARF